MNGWHAYDEWERTMTMSPETRTAVREGAKRSAAAILPMIFNMLGMPECVLDVGAGEGWWTQAARAAGAQNATGVDGEPMHEFGIELWDAEIGDLLPRQKHGLPTWDGGKRWPLALCLETAEHLTPSAGDHLVAELCRVADEIVWSAAIPGQGGDGHINEQWPSYWCKRFNAHGYVLDDPWRLDLWNEHDVEPWYAQNLLYAFKPAHGAPTSMPLAPLALVHPTTWSHHRGVTAPGAV